MTFKQPTRKHNNRTCKHTEITLPQLSLHLVQPQPVGDNETVLPYLETFVLSENPLCYLPDTLFKPLRNSNVTSLYLKNCNIDEFCKLDCVVI